MTTQSQYDEQVYQLAYDYLLSFAGVTEERVEHYLTTSDCTRPPDMRSIFRRLVISAQNRDMMATVIGEAIGGIDNMGDVLFDFDPAATVADYGDDSERLLNVVVEQLKPRGAVRRVSRAKWPQFCRSVLSGAQFLSEFDSPDDFYAWCDQFDVDEHMRLDLPLTISDRVFGFGFPLACDFIKELGYRNFGKPDTHVIALFTGLGLSRSDDPIRIAQAIQRVARSVGRDAFAVDKLFWLIGTDRLGVGTDRDAFIRMARDTLAELVP